MESNKSILQRCAHISIHLSCMMLCAMTVSACGENATQAILKPSTPVQQLLIRPDFADAAAVSRQVGALGFTLGDTLHPMLLGCSAVLLGPTTVLTAAHCIASWTKAEKKPGNRIALHFTLSRDIGHSNRDNTARVVATVTHPNYSVRGESGFKDSLLTAGGSDIDRLIEQQCGKEEFYLPQAAANQDDESQLEAALVAEEGFYSCFTALLEKNYNNPKFMAKFLPSEGVGDIAVLFLDRPIQSARETALVFKDTEDNLRARKKVLIVSYGKATTEPQQQSTAMGSIDGFKQMGRMRVDALSPTEALVSSDTTALCFGDSGGGVFAQQGSDYALVGIAVRGSTSALTRSCVNPGIFTRVAPFVPWIEAVIAARGREVTERKSPSWWEYLTGKTTP